MGKQIFPIARASGQAASDDQEKARLKRNAELPKLTKRLVDALERDADRDVFVWDSEVRGFGVRVKPSGTKTFIILAKSADMFVFAWKSSSHQAFYCVKDSFTKGEPIWAPGKGTASILRAVLDNLA